MWDQSLAEKIIEKYFFSIFHVFHVYFSYLFEITRNTISFHGGKFWGSEGLNALGNLKGGKVKLLTGSNSVGKKLTSIFQGEFTWYYKKEHLKNSSVNLILLIKYCRYFRSSNICERPLPDATCFDLFEKCRLKWAILAFLIFQIITWYFIDLYFTFGSKNKFGW